MNRFTPFLMLALFALIFFAQPSSALGISTNLSYSPIVTIVFDDTNMDASSIYTTPPPELQGISVAGSPFKIENVDPSFERYRVIGGDDRIRITPTTSYPWTTLVQIDYTMGGVSGRVCTGWMIGISSIATAAHCIFDNGSFGSGYKITPALDGNIKPFRTCRGINAHVPQQWVNARNFDYDWGVIDLNCWVGRETNVLGFRVTAGDINGMLEFVSGYPTVSHPNGVDVGTSLWTHGETIKESYQYTIRYDNDMTGGQSGGPVWQTNNIPQECTTPCPIGINSSEFEAPTLNQGVRITQEVFDNLYVRRQFVYTAKVYVPTVWR